MADVCRNKRGATTPKTYVGGRPSTKIFLPRSYTYITHLYNSDFKGGRETESDY